MAEGKLDILSSKSSDQSWTPKGGRSKTETKRTDSKMEMEPGKLFIGGISWDTNEDRLREYFQTFGEVVEAVIMKDRNSMRACGFGFVVF
ncbi:Heterogeneous nuclear ribonucleoprotein 1 [Camellia lanceoleosa]|uniref:Heterogeneous nuclear ribonucleoprotein 1 n=1 Tax=Camellia lanceoleosa TaxID=1840588 RepID=A0ACC0HCM7_9ERIC|nr:Heterogeneous nuclear ribonucleoprotein 1 [Camellia lanceoleosa]